MHRLDSESILGVQINVLDYPMLIDFVQNTIELKQRIRLVAINPEKIMKCRSDAQLRALINDFEVKIADGIGVLLGSQLHGGKIRHRVTGVDTMMRLCALANERAYRVFLYGASPDSLAKAKAKLQQQFPQLSIVGSMDGYVKDTQAIVSSIADSQAQIVFVALGSPKQEIWITQHVEQLPVNVWMGVGGSFDVLSETTRRAPVWSQKLGLEWLVRLVQQPQRLGRQSALVVYLFLILVRWGKAFRDA